MTNDQRRQKITELKEQIYPINHEKLMLSLRYNFLSNPYQTTDESKQNEIKELAEKINNLNEKIQPLIAELLSLQVKYMVEYDGEAYHNGILATIPNKRIFYLSSDCEIDSYKQIPDYSNKEIWELLKEIADEIYTREYTNFTIQHVRKIQ